FYELGAPLGLTTARLDKEKDAQQVTAVERGYNLFQANCARCHGPNGLGPLESPQPDTGYIGPTLHSQEKLYQHLNPDYLRNVLTVGGRYVCGNPKSAMPVWSDVNGGPLNYIDIQDLIAFIRATSDQTYQVRDPSLNEPVVDPSTGQVKTFHGWVDPDYKTAVVVDQPTTKDGETQTYVYPGLPAGTYVFICSIHPIPAMTGTLTVK